MPIVENNNPSLSPQLLPPSGSITALPTSTTPPPPSPINSPIEPNGLIFPRNSNLSNGLSSRVAASNAGITDFTIVNPYVHYNLNLQFDPRSFLQEATIRFNIYSSQYRNIT